jgi:hypothetical protein
LQLIQIPRDEAGVPRTLPVLHNQVQEQIRKFLVGFHSQGVDYDQLHLSVRESARGAEPFFLYETQDLLDGLHLPQGREASDIVKKSGSSP